MVRDVRTAISTQGGSGGAALMWRSPSYLILGVTHRHAAPATGGPC